MKGIVVGLGSMGKRRMRLMKQFFPEMELVGVDSREDRRKEASELTGFPCVDSIDAAGEAECAFVCTGPLGHASLIEALLRRGLHVFTEINLLDDGYESNTALARDKGLTLFLSSTPIYRREMRFVEDTVKQTEGSIVYRYHVGQYLPDWHPWENYKDFFVGDKRTNGCREIFGIELPWLTRVFGKVVGWSAVSMKQTTLSIDYNDSYLVTLTHESGAVGQLAVNVVSRKAVRDLEIVGENLYLKWLGTPATLTVYDFDKKEDVHIDTYDKVEKDSRYAASVIENMYVDELAAFFGALRGEDVRRHTFEEDKELLQLIDEIEEETV